MYSRLSFALMAVFFAALPSQVPAKSDPNPLFTLQIGSFPDRIQAERLAVGLVKAGETPVLDTVEIPGRGLWTRIFVGLFPDADSARQKGLTLLSRGMIREFLIKTIESTQSLTRPRRLNGESQDLSQTPKANAQSVQPEKAVPRSPAYNRPARVVRTEPTVRNRATSQKLLKDTVRPSLPVAQANRIRLAQKVDTNLIPRPDPVNLAFKLVTGETRQPQGSGELGGLWVSGDTAEGLARLRWIAGERNAHLIELDDDGRVRFDAMLLARAAGRGVTSVEDPLEAVEYISSNEGLLLLVQVAQGRFRYLLHIGRMTPTLGKSVDTAGSINLDNNIDSRINPYRKNGRKLDSERPPEGFDSLVAMNPVARWFNLNSSCWVHPGEIVFHELAEAYAKLEFGLDYLDQGSRLGAHTIALVREARLKSQRPEADIVITTGSNRLLRTEQEIRLFTAEASAGANQR